MPYKSKAQRNFFHYLESKGKMPKKVVDEFDETTDDGKLPPKAYAMGGYVGRKKPENFDQEVGHAEEYDSSGEPHTEDELEDRHPMEFMNRGGRVKKMSDGGRVRSKFMMALRGIR